MEELPEENRRIYRLWTLHEWADLDDLAPDRPTTPEDLQLDTVTDEQVEDVDELYINDPLDADESPEFSEDSRAVDASPEELEMWMRAAAEYDAATERYRSAVEAAATAYEAAITVAQAELRLAAQTYAPVNEQVRARSRELAATLNAHHQAAEEWEAAQDKKKQDALDAEFGPRMVALHTPDRVNSPNRQQRIAKVHLATCKLQPKPRPGALRAYEAWELLKDPDSSINRGALHRETEVKFCSSCRPWKTFQERIQDFPQARYTGDRRIPMLGPVRLAEIPDNWHQ